MEKLKFCLLVTEIKCARNKIFTEYQETSTKVKNLTVDNENLTVEIVNLRFRLTTLESERRSQIAASPEMEKILACKDEEISIVRPFQQIFY